MKQSRLGRALGTNPRLIARWVAAHERVCECEVAKVGWSGRCARCHGRAVEAYQASQIAVVVSDEELEIGDAKIAMALRYARADGYARMEPGDEGDLWFPTEKALAEFPPSEPHVMPDPEEATLDGGTFRAMDERELRVESEREGAKWIPIDDPTARRHLPRGD